MRKLHVLSMAVAVVLGIATPAFAQTDPALTLSASSTKIVYGKSVHLSGTATGQPSGTSVEIRDETGNVVAIAATDDAGAFATVITPEGTRTYRAALGDVTSDPVTVRVRAVVSVRLPPVRLFDSVTVRGRVQPARPGRRVEVLLLVGGRRVDTKRVAMGSSGGFKARFMAEDAGTFRARASFSTTDLIRGTALSNADATPLPPLNSGDAGTFVRLLEKRLVDLHYRLAGAKDGRYDFRTADAIVAFHKVQGMSRSFVVDAATWRRLAKPLRPNPREDWRGFHIEVDQTRQVLYTVEDGEITNVLHISTGAGGATHDGTFSVFRKLAGFSGHHLYYPSYFDGLRALHGWTEVPTYAASHGCVRIPYWNAIWVYGLADYGTRVVIYH